MQRLRWLSIAVLVVPSRSVLHLARARAVQRIPEDSVTDLRSAGTTAPARCLVADEMIDDCLERPDGSTGTRRARTSVPTTVIVGVVRTTARAHRGRDLHRRHRARLRRLRARSRWWRAPRARAGPRRAGGPAGISNASQQTVKEWGKGTGPTASWADPSTRSPTRTRAGRRCSSQVDLSLSRTSRPTRKVWLGQKKIKKLITHPKAKCLIRWRAPVSGVPDEGLRDSRASRRSRRAESPWFQWLPPPGPSRRRRRLRRDGARLRLSSLDNGRSRLLYTPISAGCCCTGRGLDREQRGARSRRGPARGPLRRVSRRRSGRC